jgi:hypothetical protein
MRVQRRLRRLEVGYKRRALATLSDEETLFLLRFCRRGLRDGVETIAVEHQNRALPLMTLLFGEWS